MKNISRDTLLLDAVFCEIINKYNVDCVRLIVSCTATLAECVCAERANKHYY